MGHMEAAQGDITTFEDSLTHLHVYSANTSLNPLNETTQENP